MGKEGSVIVKVYFGNKYMLGQKYLPGKLFKLKVALFYAFINRLAHHAVVKHLFWCSLVVWFCPKVIMIMIICYFDLC